METNEDITRLTSQFVANTYGRTPITLVRGKGARVWDKSGNSYLDFVTGLAVDNLGHCHPAVVQAIRKQAGQLIHVSNLYHIEPQSLLAKELATVSFADKFFFCNSGTEANEAAIKLVRRYAHDCGFKNKIDIITMKNSFHGRTMGSLSATGQSNFQKGFKPLLPGFKYVPFNNIEALEKVISKKTCAILIEPIQGEGGVNLAEKNYLKALRKICNTNKIVLIFDEVQTGFGRTGHLFAYERYGVKPDVITLAKALGGGMAIGALGATKKIIQSFTPGTHAATFGGNPVACAAARASLSVLTRNKFLESCRETGGYFLSRLMELRDQVPYIKEVRGAGMMLAAELDHPGANVVINCMRQGVLINCIQGNILRFLPPLTVTRKEIDRVVRVLSKSLKLL